MTGQVVALFLQARCEPGVPVDLVVEPMGHRPLQVGRGREYQELVRLGDNAQQLRRRRHVADLPAGQRALRGGGTAAPGALLLLQAR